MTSDESLELQELSLELYINLLEMKRLVTISFIEQELDKTEAKKAMVVRKYRQNFEKSIFTKSTQWIYCIYDEKPNMPR